MRKRVVIVIGAPVKNMGSQAILRGLTKNIKDAYPDVYITVVATDDDFDDSLNLPGVDNYMKRYSIEAGRYNYPRIINGIRTKIFKQRFDINRYRLYYPLQECNKADMVVIVGADNYDKSYKSLPYMWETNKYIEEFGVDKTVLFNCSVAEDDLFDKALADISRFKYVTARDSVSYANLKKALPNNDVRFYPDVAFCMDKEETSLPEGWESGNMIGINVSSLIGDGRYGITEEMVLKSYEHMIDYIIQNTELKICFIPHVKKNADLSVLRKLYDYVEDKNRAILIEHENYNAAQKKYIISNCRMFVGARTHSTIAAYSTCVPTLVVGYSVKSVGIATDLFGTSDGYVVPINKMIEPDYLLNAFKLFLENETRIQGQLNKMMPSYIEKSFKVKELFKKILGDGVHG